jgi:succinyl-diaminopimelate desuccinylase
MKFGNRAARASACQVVGCMLGGNFSWEEDAVIMNDLKRQLATWIDDDREPIIGFLCDFVRAKSPNPPGDTTLAAAHLTRFFEAHALPFRVIAPQPTMPNIVGSFEGAKPGPHLVLNGHIDVFPADERNERWTYGPWSGTIADGKIYGRGVADMKAGTSASVFTYYYLYRVRDHLKGRLTLTAVSDEETFGPWGARYLMERHPEVHGDCLLNGEPSSPLTIRFGEKGPLWLKFTVRTKGAHGAYTHLSPSATKIAARLILDLEDLTALHPSVPVDIADALAGAAAAIDEAQGPGAKDIVQRVTVNIGVIQGGQKVNMVPGTCWFEADIRVPSGLGRDEVLAKIRQILAGYPEATVEEINYSAPSVCDPNHEMVGILRANARALGRPDPTPIVSLGGTDARLWRQRGIPGLVHGPFPRGMAQADEHVEIEEYLHIVRMHVLSAFDYLSR